MEFVQIALFWAGGLFVFAILMAYSINLSNVMTHYRGHHKLLIKCLVFMLLFSVFAAALFVRAVMLLTERGSSF